MGLGKSKHKTPSVTPPAPPPCPEDGSSMPRTPSGHMLPNPIHQRLSPQQLPQGRLIVIGDVHGCYEELLALLEACEYKPGCDALFFVGDLVNKGPSSPQVLDFATRHKAFVVRGNHDEAAITAYEKLHRGEPIKSKFKWVSHLSPAQLTFLHSLPFSIIIPELQLLFVHAGVVPGVPLEQQRLIDLYKMRHVVHDAEGHYQAKEDGSDEQQAWAHVWQGPQHVFFGHDAKRKLQHETYATGLDTGCVYGGQLTACVLPPVDQLVDHLKAVHGTPTLEQLGGCLVSVNAAKEYEVKKDKSGSKKKGCDHDDGVGRGGAGAAATTTSSSVDVVAGEDGVEGGVGGDGEVEEDVGEGGIAGDTRHDTKKKKKKKKKNKG